MRFCSRWSLHQYLPAVALRAYYTVGKHRIFWDVSENVEGPAPILTSEETIVDPSVPVFPIFPPEGGDGTVIGQEDYLE